MTAESESLRGNVRESKECNGGKHILVVDLDSKIQPHREDHLRNLQVLHVASSDPASSRSRHNSEPKVLPIFQNHVSIVTFNPDSRTKSAVSCSQPLEVRSFVFSKTSWSSPSQPLLLAFAPTSRSLLFQYTKPRFQIIANGSQLRSKVSYIQRDQQA